MVCYSMCCVVVHCWCVQVVACIKHVQQQLVATAPELQPCLLEPVTAHMTVMVLVIQTQVRTALVR
jgi:hypothetical protein